MGGFFLGDFFIGGAGGIFREILSDLGNLSLAVIVSG